MFSSITVAMDGTVLLFEEQREKGVVEVNPGGPVLLLGLQKKPFSPMYSAQIRSSRTFLQKQIPSSSNHVGLRSSNNPVSNWPARMKDWMHSSGWLKR